MIKNILKFGLIVIFLFLANETFACFEFNNLSVKNQTDTNKAEIIKLQILLKSAGQYSGPVTGFYGSLTEASIKEIQRSEGIDATGVIDNLTKESICSFFYQCPFVSNLKKNDISPRREIEVLQSFLSFFREVYAQKLVTGFYGTLTETAVTKFQREVGVEETGMIDEDTRRELCTAFDNFKNKDVTKTIPKVSASSSSSSSSFKAICVTFPSSTGINQQVAFIPQTLGGVAPYTYQWSGDINSKSRTVTKSFDAQGTYTANLKVIDKNGKVASGSCGVRIGAGLVDFNQVGSFGSSEAIDIQMAIDKEVVNLNDSFQIAWKATNADQCSFYSHPDNEKWNALTSTSGVVGIDKIAQSTVFSINCWNKNETKNEYLKISFGEKIESGTQNNYAYSGQANKIKMSVNKDIVKAGERFVISWSTGDIPAVFCKFNTGSSNSQWSRINNINNLPGQGKAKYDVTSGQFETTYGSLRIAGSSPVDYYRIDCLEKNNNVISAVLYVERNKKPILIYDGDSISKPSASTFPKFVSRDEFGNMMQDIEILEAFFKKVDLVGKVTGLQSTWYEPVFHRLVSWIERTSPVGKPGNPFKPFLEDWITSFLVDFETSGGISNNNSYSRSFVFMMPTVDSSTIKRWEDYIDLGAGMQYNKLTPMVRKRTITVEEKIVSNLLRIKDRKETISEEYLKVEFTPYFLLLPDFADWKNKRNGRSDLSFDQTALEAYQKTDQYKKYLEQVKSFNSKGISSGVGMNGEIWKVVVKDSVVKGRNTEYILDFFDERGQIYKSIVLDALYDAPKVSFTDPAPSMPSNKSLKTFGTGNPNNCKLGDLGVRKECDTFFKMNNICVISLGAPTQLMYETLSNCFTISDVPSVSF